MPFDFHCVKIVILVNLVFLIIGLFISSAHNRWNIRRQISWSFNIWTCDVDIILISLRHSAGQFRRSNLRLQIKGVYRSKLIVESSLRGLNVCVWHKSCILSLGMWSLLALAGNNFVRIVIESNKFIEHAEIDFVSSLCSCLRSLDLLGSLLVSLWFRFHVSRGFPVIWLLQSFAVLTEVVESWRINFLIGIKILILLLEVHLVLIRFRLIHRRERSWVILIAINIGALAILRLIYNIFLRKVVLAFILTHFLVILTCSLFAFIHLLSIIGRIFLGALNDWSLFWPLNQFSFHNSWSLHAWEGHIVQLSQVIGKVDLLWRLDFGQSCSIGLLCV